jgi:hypothetical protein
MRSLHRPPDGRAVRSCTLPISAADGKSVTTIEGLADGTMHKVQQAWVANQGSAVTPSGMTAAVAGFRPEPGTDDDIDAGITNIAGGTFARVGPQSVNRRRRRSGVMKKWTRRAFIGAGMVWAYSARRRRFPRSRQTRHTLISADTLKRAAHDVDYRDAREHHHDPHPALRDGPGRADRARNDGR